jgi:hypothetical protein|tara:strand:- start:425 stop:1132 length:708 start_codon:yes stop_codon:yes gene_type:complete
MTVITDDFLYGDLVGDDTAVLGGLGAAGWLVTDVVGSADSDIDLISGSATLKNHPGIIRLNTGPSSPQANDESSLSLQNLNGLVLPDVTDGDRAAAEYIYMVTWVLFPTEITNHEFNFGLFDAADAAGRAVNGVSAEFDQSADLEWNLVVTDGSSSSAFPGSLVVAADTWQKIELFASEDHCALWVNNEFQAQTDVKTNIPDDEPLFPVYKVATEAAGEEEVHIDAFQARIPVTR